MAPSLSVTVCLILLSYIPVLALRDIFLIGKYFYFIPLVSLGVCYFSVSCEFFSVGSVIKGKFVVLI